LALTGTPEELDDCSFEGLHGRTEAVAELAGL
jgi:hypothetical protein